MINARTNAGFVSRLRTFPQKSGKTHWIEGSPWYFGYLGPLQSCNTLKYLPVYCLPPKSCNFPPYLKTMLNQTSPAWHVLGLHWLHPMLSGTRSFVHWYLLVPPLPVRRCRERLSEVCPAKNPLTAVNSPVTSMWNNPRTQQKKECYHAIILVFPKIGIPPNHPF